MPRSFSSIGRRAGQRLRTRGGAIAVVPLLNGKVVDLTGPGVTQRWGVMCADLGPSVVAPNGKLVSVFGDTFSGRKIYPGRVSAHRRPINRLGIAHWEDRGSI